MPKWFSGRTIVEEKIVEKKVDRFSRRFGRFEEAFEALKWLLARKCDDIGSLSRVVGDVDYSIHRQAGSAVTNTPDITVLFTYDDDEVIIIDVRAEKPEEDES